MLHLPLRTVEHNGPDGVQQVIFLKSRLSLAGMGAFQSEYQALTQERGAAPSGFELRVLLLMHYLHSWRGGLLDSIPCDRAALNILDADMPILYLAMDAAYELHFTEAPLPPTGQGKPIDDPRHADLVKRWTKKLGSKKATTEQAGNHDGVVSLMVRFGWTEQQTLTENSPEVLAELYARLEAQDKREARESKRTARDGKPGTFPTGAPE